MGYPAELETIYIVLSSPPGPGLNRDAIMGLADDYARSMMTAGNTSHTLSLRRRIESHLSDPGGFFIELEDKDGRSLRLAGHGEQVGGYYRIPVEVNQAKIVGRS